MGLAGDRELGVEKDRMTEFGQGVVWGTPKDVGVGYAVVDREPRNGYDG